MGNSGTVVNHTNFDLISLLSGCYYYFFLRRGIFIGIVQEVNQDLPDSVLFGRDSWKISFYINDNSSFTWRKQTAYCFPNQFRQRKRAARIIKTLACIKLSQDQ